MKIIKQTQAWLQAFIIEYNICPFAKKVFDQNSINYVAINSIELETCLQSVFTECQRLDNQAEIETSLIIFSKKFGYFEDFLDFLFLSETLLHEQGYDGVYQIASFHPQYCFEGESPDDPANYTNRSPYPMLHLIREESIEKVLKNFSHPENIPKRNIRLTRKMGGDKLLSIIDKAKRDLN